MRFAGAELAEGARGFVEPLVQLVAESDSAAPALHDGKGGMMGAFLNSCRHGLLVLTLLVPAVNGALAAEPSPQPAQEQDLEVTDSVAVTPRARDVDIAGRLQRILLATGWFRRPDVRVREGIVFLEGVADSEQHREWATRLGRNTEDVLAVVNRMAVPERSVWDLSPAWKKLHLVAAEAVRAFPLILVAAAMIIASWIVARWSFRGASRVLRHRFRSLLVSEVMARAVALPVFILGLYVVLRISGLTGLALSLLGGTGLAGLIIGFAFRDIAENFLASLLISSQRPFATGDLITVVGHTGFVQRVNTRATLLMTLEGNHVQIPNSTIYKSTITNFTANPNERFDFLVGIGYEGSIANAQTVALDVLRDHPAVLSDPEPLVLAERLGAATVDLRIYFWVDITVHSALKVKSSVIRLVKRAFDQAGISMPDEAREVVFPHGVPIRQMSKRSHRGRSPSRSVSSSLRLTSLERDGRAVLPHLKVGKPPLSVW